MHLTTFNKGKVTPCVLNKKKKCRPRKGAGINCPGFPGGCLTEFFERRSHMAIAKATDEAQNDMPMPPLARNRGFLSPRFPSNHVTLSSWFLQNQTQTQFEQHSLYYESDAFSEEL